MDYLEIKARAKINFSIDVTGKRENGYHEVKMVMQSLKLHDIVKLERIREKIELFCDSDEIPSDEYNIAYKAAVAFFTKYNVNGGIRINIEKKIPVCAGLAGGSTDAAAVLKGMNVLFDVGARKEELCALGLKLGADVPYCIQGGTKLAEGIGEKLTQLKPVKHLPIIIVKPGISVSTKWVYQKFKLDNPGERPDTESIIHAITTNDYKSLAEKMRNVLESVTAKQHSIINEIKASLNSNGAMGSLMSGSGSAVFGVFANHFSAQKAYNLLRGEGWDCFLTETYSEEI